MRKISWAVGLTTVPERRGELLPRTINSLRNAGFVQLRLFVDGPTVGLNYEEFALPITFRDPKVGVFGHWVLTLWELYVRDPRADRYAIFQDDLVTYPNLKTHLDRHEFPERGYWNLYSCPQNEQRVPLDDNKQPITGWHESNQMGRGAVALVFNRDGVAHLLGHPKMATRPQDYRRGTKSVDGAVCNTMKSGEWVEWVHYPSLIQHTGQKSSMGNRPHPISRSFIGEKFNAVDLIPATNPKPATT